MTLRTVFWLNIFFWKAYDADAIAQAACAGSSSGGFVSAIRRACDGTQATCDSICGSAISGMREIYGNQGSTTYVLINVFAINRNVFNFIVYFDRSLTNIVDWENVTAVYEDNYYKSIITTGNIYKQSHKFPQGCRIDLLGYNMNIKIICLSLWSIFNEK